MSDIRLTKYTKFSGCGAKLGPGLLDRALCDLSQPSYPELLVDFTTSDDAGIYQVSDDIALVQTVDFFPPIVDDPFTFGQIAAANALSDIYAMGGKPATALSIVGFPVDEVDISVLRHIMEGALDRLQLAGAPLVGGHSINDDELKFGLAVTGTIHPSRVLRNSGIRPGDTLILTKPLGTGTINSALRAGKASEDAITAATQSMVKLNKDAAAVLASFDVHACTDVTGFGLLGHLCEMLVGSGTGIRIQVPGLKLFPETFDYVKAGFVPGGTGRNRSFREPFVANAAELGDDLLNLLFDPQTSGGLLAAVSGDSAGSLVDTLVKSGVDAFPVGTVVDGAETIVVEV